MDLAELLAREGYADNDLPRLLAWARARADALLAETDVAAPLRRLLTPSEHVSEDSPEASLDDDDDPLEPVAAVAAAAEAASEEDAPIDLRRAVTAATAPHPVAVEDDDVESGLGGFARFGGIGRMKNRPYPFREESEPEERPTLARSFALAAEKAAEERDAPPITRAPTPAAAAPAGEISGTLPMAALGISAEESGGLVLGIPDDDAADVPVSRASSSSPSAGLPRASSRSGALVDDDDDQPLAGALIDDDEPPAAPARRVDDGGRPGRPVVDDDDLSESALDGLTEATDSELLAVSNVLSEASGPAVPAARQSSAPVIHEPSGVDLSRPIPVGGREPTGPRDAAVEPSEPHDDPQAPVLRRRTPKKKVVELGAPVGRPRGGSGSAPVTPKSPRKAPPPPPPPGRRTTPRHEEIEELSRVEVLEDLPAYLRDDED